MGIDNTTPVKVATECILVGCPSIVGDFNPSTLTGRVVVNVEVGRFVKAMQDGPDRGRREIVVDIGVAAR